MKLLFQTGGVLFLLLNLVGCASKALVKPATLSANGGSVSVDFVWVRTTTSVAAAETDRQFFHDTVITGLRETQLFGAVSGDQADGSGGDGLKVVADIKALKRVSTDARIWFGALAGRAQIAVQVTISDFRSGRLIRSFEVDAVSGESARAGTTDEAMQRAAQQIVAELVSLSRQTNP